MRAQLDYLLRQALAKVTADHGPLEPGDLDPQLDRARDPQHGDFTSNIALRLAQRLGVKPRELASRIAAALPPSPFVGSTEVAGAGFINFRLVPAAYHEELRKILDDGPAYGCSDIGAGQRVIVEYVSANPTGPLHVGHGRHAAYGASLASLLRASGHEVHEEYYVNDAGRQMDILGTSVWLRYLELAGETLTFPANGYKGDYVWDIAATLHREHGDAYRHPAADLFAGIPADEPAGGDKEAHIDALIMRAKELLGAADYRKVFDLGLDTILADIRQDLEEFGVAYEEWYSERQLVESGKVDAAIEALKKSGHVYEEKGALWFRSTEFGDEKDRVVVRDNGVKTYFASDIAYHWHKLDRGFDQVIDIWGADHHGYVPRVKAALTAMGDKADADKLDVLLVQFAILYRGGERVQMSTRSGSFVTLRELREEVGNDAARFFYVMRKCEQHMDFDLDLAKSQSNDNPMFYIQYAHARVCSVMRQMAEKGLSYDQGAGLNNLALLGETHEQELMRSLSRYPEVVEAAALNHEPHQLAHYLRELANDFHTYYNAHQFLVDQAGLRDARLTLIQAARQVLGNGLALLGVSAPESM
ncbi:MAG TPA: arginine--tRNA ligase [Gammaproteobacteria bacterium]